MLGIFSPWEYTWTTPGPGLIMVGTFIAVFLSVTGVVYLNYPDMVAYPREFENGLQRELGGPGAVRVGDSWPRRRAHANKIVYRLAWRVMRTLEQGILICT